MPKLSVVKIGGAVIEDSQKLYRFLEDFAKIKGPKILVHGGGKKATEMAKKLNIPIKIKEGRRITDSATLEVITGIYGGQINKKIVAQLQRFNCNALGLSGADGNAIRARKRPVKTIDFGFVGDITSVNRELFIALLSQNICPVCCALSHDGNGQLLNTNADTIAAEIGKNLAQDFETALYFCFEMNGVMKDVNDPSSLIERITKKDYKELLENNILSQGMLPKMHNAFDALENGVREVAIGSTEMINTNTSYTSITL